MNFLQWLVSPKTSAATTSFLLRSPREESIVELAASENGSTESASPVGAKEKKRVESLLTPRTSSSTKKRRRLSSTSPLEGEDEENDSDFVDDLRNVTGKQKTNVVTKHVGTHSPKTELESQEPVSPMTRRAIRMKQRQESSMVDSPLPSTSQLKGTPRPSAVSEASDRIKASILGQSPTDRIKAVFASPKVTHSPQIMIEGMKRKSSTSGSPSMFASPRPSGQSNLNPTKPLIAPFSLPLISTPSTSASSFPRSTIPEMTSSPSLPPPATTAATQTYKLKATGTPPLTGPRSRKLLYAILTPTSFMMDKDSPPAITTESHIPSSDLLPPTPSAGLTNYKPRAVRGLESDNVALKSKSPLVPTGLSVNHSQPETRTSRSTSFAALLDPCDAEINSEDVHFESGSLPTVRKLSFESAIGTTIGQEMIEATTSTNGFIEDANKQLAIPYSWVKVHPILARVRSQVCPERVEDAKEFFGLEINRERLAQVLYEAYVKKEPASVLLVGPKGSGKNHCLCGALRDVRKKDKLMSFKVIELDGKFLVNDALAAREVTRQLCLTMHHGVMASLESLEDAGKESNDEDDDESSSSDDDEEQEREVKRSKGISKPQELGGTRGTFSDHLRFLVRVLKEELNQSVRLLFLLKNFEDFCRRPKQTLLYALLDMAHSPDARFVLVAVSEGIDCISNLDKRVRSRFDNIQLVFPKQAYTLDGMVHLLKSRLLIETKNPSEQVESWNKSAIESIADFQPTLHALMMAGGLTVGFVLQHIVCVAIARLQRVLWQADPRSLNFSAVRFSFSSQNCLDFSATLKYCVEDQQGNHVRIMPREELVLLLAAVYLERVRQMDSYSFEALYEASHKIRKGSPDSTEAFQIKPTRKEVSLMSFDSLVRKRFLAPSGLNRKNVPKEYRPMRLVFEDVDASLLQYVRQKPETFHLSLVYWAKHLLNQ